MAIRVLAMLVIVASVNLTILVINLLLQLLEGVL